MRTIQPTARMRLRVDNLKAKGALRLPVATSEVKQDLRVQGVISRAASLPTGEVHPERAAKAAGGIQQLMTPPFNRRVEAPYQRYANQLTPEEVMILDWLYESGVRTLQAAHGRLVQSYERVRVDLPYRQYQHLTPQERSLFEQFHAVWRELGPLQGIAANLVFEIPAPGSERALSLSEVGALVSNYRDERRAIGAGVACLRLLAWRITQVVRGEKKSKSHKKGA